MRYHDPQSLIDHGLDLPVPDAVWIGREVPLANVAAEGIRIHPGCRVQGEESVLGAGLELGKLGPVYLDNVATGRDVSVQRGSAEGCVLLDGASLGPDAHVRSGTLLEEEASTGHAVGLKQTIILSFGTLGSQINFCDCLLSGGRSRSDHSEVGSGFIHFNFTPFGARGDKVTASLFGDVVQGATLRHDRVFLGGAGGVVGPIEIGFGTVLAAGSVYRRSHPGGQLVYADRLEAKARAFDPMQVRGLSRRVDASIRYIGELRALDAWYREVRMPREPDALVRKTLASGRRLIAGAIKERVKQVQRLLDGLEGVGNEERDRIVAEWDERRSILELPSALGAPKELAQWRERPGSHVDWTQGLASDEADALEAWLKASAAS